MRTVLLGSLLIAGCGMAAPEATACVDQRVALELHVDATDPRGAWAEPLGGGAPIAVRPRPPGRFQFDPERPTMVFDADGDVVTFAGEITRSACVSLTGDVIYIGPGDVPDPDRGPN
jgi:hypothetical protein